jgi:hypothetical protein
MAAFFKVFLNMECHKKEFLNIQMETYIMASSKIINQTDKVFGNSKKVFFRELLRMEIS